MSVEDSRISNAMREVADNYNRLTRSNEKLNKAITAGREAGLSEEAIAIAIRTSCNGRPDRIRAVEAYFVPGAVG